MPATQFHQSWTREFPWAKEHNNIKLSALCTWCNTTFSFDTMGRSAFVSHSKGKKHKNVAIYKAKTHPLNYIFPPKQGSSSPSGGTSQTLASLQDPDTPSSSTSQVQVSSTSQMSSSSSSSFPKPTSTLNKFVLKDSVTQAEIVWCLHTIHSHMSLRDSENGVKAMKVMFPECRELAELKLHKDKIAYSIVYGLAYYFSSKLKNELKTAKLFVVGFDESLNRIAQRTQMDLNVRYWDEESNQVRTRYLTSKFMDHTKATDLLEGFKDGLTGLDLNKILQISMDGPNVNWAFLRMFKEDVESESSLKILEIGSCGLHTLHGAFKTGLTATDWKLINFFRSVYNLFKNVPARRGDFASITKTDLFPHKFCNIRWLDNTKVAARCLELLPALKIYVDKVKDTKTEPDCGSYKTVSTMITDKLLPAKIAFFKSIAEEFEPFLKEFQSEAPLVPFLHGAISQLLNNLMARFVKKEVLSQTNFNKLNLELKKDGLYENLLPAKDIDLGYATRCALRKCSGVSSKEILVFRKEVRTCLLTIVNKILKKSPIKYPVTESLTALNPAVIARSKEEAYKKLTSLLDCLVEKNILRPNVAESADREFKGLISLESVTTRMANYQRSDKRLDDFWVDTLNSNSNIKTTNLKVVVKLCLILSHGNASVERGFSVNKEILVENLQEQSLVAQRIVYDEIADKGGIENMLPVPKGLILSMRSSYSRFKEDEEARKKRMTEKDRSAADKRKAQHMVKQLEEKRMKLMAQRSEEIANLEEEIKNVLSKSS